MRLTRADPNKSGQAVHAPSGCMAGAAVARHRQECLCYAAGRSCSIPGGAHSPASLSAVGVGTMKGFAGLHSIWAGPSAARPYVRRVAVPATNDTGETPVPRPYSTGHGRPGHAWAQAGVPVLLPRRDTLPRIVIGSWGPDDEGICEAGNFCLTRRAFDLFWAAVSPSPRRFVLTGRWWAVREPPLHFLTGHQAFQGFAGADQFRFLAVHQHFGGAGAGVVIRR